MDMSTVSTRDDELTLFAINDKSYREMCPSGNCTFEIDHLIGPHFTPPNPETMRMWGSFHFKLKDKVDNPNIGEKEQEFLEKFDVLFSCKVEDIIEDNGQEIYTCHDTSIVNREFDSKTWDYNTVVKFDAKNETVKVYGNYAGVDRW